MTSDAAVRLAPLSPFEQLRDARDIIEIEGQALPKSPNALAPNSAKPRVCVTSVQAA